MLYSSMYFPSDISDIGDLLRSLKYNPNEENIRILDHILNRMRCMPEESNKEVLEKFETLVREIFGTLCKVYEKWGYEYFYEIDDETMEEIDSITIDDDGEEESDDDVVFEIETEEKILIHQNFQGT